MALTAKLDSDFLLGRADCKSVAAGTNHFRFREVLGMYLFFHVSLFSVNADFSPVIAIRFVFHDTVNQRKDSIVFAETNVNAGMNPGTALTD